MSDEPGGDEWDDAQRSSLLNKIRDVFPDGAPIPEVLGCLATAFCTIAEEYGLEPESAIASMSRALTRYRQDTRREFDEQEDGHKHE